jgi:hypothetical protein
MGYFRELPNLAYQSFLSHKNSSQEYVIAKNLFRRVKLRDDLYNVFTLFDKYQIKDGARPDTVADEMYGSPELDWVVLTTANITNVRDQWPLSNYQLYNYAENKYGNDLSQIRFYETREVKDSSNRLILPAGKVVDKNFTIPDPNDGTKILNPVSGVTNYEYETRKNDEKRLIYLLKPPYLQEFLNDMRREMLYSESSEYINDTLIQTQNTKVTSP